MDKASYDLVVIGSGPAGQKGAIAAAKLGKKVAVILPDGLSGMVQRGALILALGVSSAFGGRGNENLTTQARRGAQGK
jgi:succinate dehydrogenase/fumarate reductase flavoprotein subunit